MNDAQNTGHFTEPDGQTVGADAEQPAAEAVEVRPEPVTALPQTSPPAYLMTKAPFGVMRLTDWLDEARAANQLAGALVNTQFVPNTLHDLREPQRNAAAIILCGYELGLSPLAALRSIYFIHGTPAIYAKAARAIVLSKGHQIEVTESTATRVKARGRRAGSETWVLSEWSMDRVKKAGIKNGQYDKNPINMLTARATAELCWLIAPDALYGIGGTVEELDDTGAIPMDGEAAEGAQAPAQPAKRTAQRKTAPRAMPTADPEPDTSRVHPVLDGNAERAAVVAEATGKLQEAPISPQQLATVHIMARERAIAREDGLRIMSEVTGREIMSTKDLRAVEVRPVLDRFGELPIVAPEPVDGE